MKYTGSIATNWTRPAIAAFVLYWLAFSSTANAEEKFRHDETTIREQAKKQPPSLWQYPSQTVFKQLAPTASLSGLVIPEPIPSRMKGIEPSFIAGMRVLSDGSLACIIPLEVQFDSAKYLFTKFWRDTITRIKVVLLDGEQGTERWSQLVSASGIFDFLEAGSVLLLQAKNYDTHGNFVDAKLVALDCRTGSILWERDFDKSFSYFILALKENLAILSMIPNPKSEGDGKVEVIDISTGKVRWAFVFAAKVGKEKNPNYRPLIVNDRIVFFEDGITCRKLADGGITWDKKDVNAEGIFQPETGDGLIYFQSQSGLVALNLSSGETAWSCRDIQPVVIYLHLTGKHIVVARSEKGFFSKRNILSIIEPSSGKILWNYAADPIFSNVEEHGTLLFFTTRNHLIALNVENGSEAYKAELPWKDKYSYHVVSLRNEAVVVENEWSVGKWNQRDGSIIYYHSFEPLCPIITTQERLQEQEYVGGSGPLATQTLTGEGTMYQNPAYSGVPFGAELIVMNEIARNVQVEIADALIHPKIDAVIGGIRDFDDDDYIVRLVGVKTKKQRFSAIEILNLSTGTSKQVLLSPYQMPSDLKTPGSSPLKATVYNGYLIAAMYVHQNFATAVDLRRKRIFHYGPGLNPDDYIQYGGSGFVRGKLSAFGLELP